MPRSDDSRAIRRSESNPILNNYGRPPAEPEKITLSMLKSSLFNKRSMLLLAFLVVSFFISNLCAVYAYKMSPSKRPLPDILASTLPSFASLRSNTFISAFASSLTYSIIFTVFLAVASYFFFNLINFRKFTFLLAISFIFRAMFFCITQLSVPCSGCQACPCQSTLYKSVAANHSVIGMALIYTVTLGIGTSSVPVCGDLMMSGSAAYQWLIGVTLIDAVSPGTTSLSAPVIRVIVYGLLIFSGITTVLLRNEYSVGIVMAAFFVKLVGWLYDGSKAMMKTGYGPFLTTPFGQLFQWIEQDLNPLPSTSNEDVSI